MCSERPNMKSMLHCLPRFYWKTPAVCSPTMGFDRNLLILKLKRCENLLRELFISLNHRKNSTFFMNYLVSLISSTARKPAVFIWNMVVKKVPYIPQTEYQFLDQKRKKIAAMKKLITKFDISTKDLNLQL